MLIASELAANAVLHSRSRDAFITVRCETFRGYAWVEVEDLGGPWHPRQRDGRPHGLDIVEAIPGPGNWEPTSPGPASGSPGHGWGLPVTDAALFLAIIAVVILLAALRAEHRKVKELRRAARRRWLS